MSHSILLTGASGYLGGTVLARLSDANLPSYHKLYVLVRTDDQSNDVKQYGAEPIRFNVDDEAEVREAVTANAISIVYYLIGASRPEPQVLFIKALGEVKKATGREVHFLHTTGAKIFSSHAGAPTNRPLLDNEPGLYEIQKSQKAPHNVMQIAVNANNTIIEQAELYGVRSYIFAPCIVYGEGEGFGNRVSIQTVAIVKAAKALRRVHSTDVGRPSWPVCHVIDNSTLYLQILRRILTSDDDLGHGSNGYYLASTGSVVWRDLYAAMAEALRKRGIVEDASVTLADDSTLQRIGAALRCPKEFVPVQIGGSCTFAAKHGIEIGWQPQFSPEHILEAADAEVDLILQNLR